MLTDSALVYRPIAQTWPFLYNSGHATCWRVQKAALEDHLYGLLYVAAALDAVYATTVARFNILGGTKALCCMLAICCMPSLYILP